MALILSLLLGLFMLWGGVLHFLRPAFYLPFVPAFLPFRAAAIPVSGALEILLGLAVLVPRTRSLAGWGLPALMVAYLPIHLWDVFRSHPAIGSHRAAMVRLPFQFLFILWAWFVATRSAPVPAPRSQS